MNSVSKQLIEKKSNQAHVLNDATQDLLHSVKKKNNKAVGWFIISWTLLFVVAIITLIFVLRGINRQNYLAEQNTDHIDCIIKTLSTPIPKGSEHRVIEYLSGECHIKFTQ